MKKTGRIHKIAISVFCIVLIAAFVVIYTFHNQIQFDTQTIQSLNDRIINATNQILGLQNQVANLNNEVSAKESTIETLSQKLGYAQSEVQSLTPVIKSYYATAVGPDGKGEVTPIQVKIINGTGAISVDINNVDFLTGVQESVRTAVSVAETYTHTSLSSKDIVVSFTNSEPYIVALDGPSAGAAITATIIAAIENKTVDSSVLVTGTINSDGRIGQVGDVAIKAVAARDFGASVFLVPSGQGTVVDGIQVTEVATISDAVSRILK